LAGGAQVKQSRCVIVFAIGLVPLVLTCCVAKPDLEQKAVWTPADLGGTPSTEGVAYDDSYDSYALQSSEITVSLKAGKISVEHKLIDADLGLVFQIFLDDPFYKTTVLNIAKRPGTNTIANAGIEVVDYRKDIVTSVGGLVKTALTVVATEGGGSLFRDTAIIDVDDEIAAKVGADTLDPSDQHAVLARLKHVADSARVRIPAPPTKAQPSPPNWNLTGDAQGITIALGPVPPDAIPLYKIASKSRHKFDGLYLSSCRTMTMRVSYTCPKGNSSAALTGTGTTMQVALPAASSNSGTTVRLAAPAAAAPAKDSKVKAGKPGTGATPDGGAPPAPAPNRESPDCIAGQESTAEFHFKVADPYFVTRRSFPANGSIVTHEQACSASTETQKPDDGLPWTGIANAISTQAEAISKALDDKDKSGGRK